ncbi:hypothetical protein SMGD1_1397 [Sulfurimonas gotlandica GD1]|uniref:Beta-ketoacyl synthase-like N-terminal domain-containing protein n=1 Tax=Sulfurimonas gotlandica (strain DSM 19862 / JCM 16533 / GD1) TaxID=929558 RepID=H1FSJ3_SULGG|nr:beta-ketoacyl synthase chain length factor [Sulfurimonas gotlandica]EHP29921.1 hypothetical protein SMGD1_1397 [Sulfurimonas gotlandica GD1]
MKVNVEIIKKAIIHHPLKIENLNEKELVTKMMIRRRLSRSSKILIYLAHECDFQKGAIVYGSAYGELGDSVAILEAINSKEAVSPTAFQNSVYNTAPSYHSIVECNTDEILTLSSGDNTSYTVMQQGALALQSKTQVFVCAIEAMNFDGVDVLNKCKDELEYGIAFVIKKTEDSANLIIQNNALAGVPNSLEWMKNLYDLCKENDRCIIEVEL